MFQQLFIKAEISSKATLLYFGTFIVWILLYFKIFVKFFCNSIQLNTSDCSIRVTTVFEYNKSASITVVKPKGFVGWHGYFYMVTT